MMRRLLRLKLTDGRTTCTAVEFKPVPALEPEHLVPGVKLCLTGASVKLGVILLDPKCIQVRHAVLTKGRAFQAS